MNDRRRLLALAEEDQPNRWQHLLQRSIQAKLKKSSGNAD